MDKADSSTGPKSLPLDPGAFNAALFEAYRGECNCAVCEILRDAVKSAIGPYLNPKTTRRPKPGNP